jgi:hypothetical protein
MSESNQAAWEWSQEDERRWHAEQALAATRQPTDKQVSMSELAKHNKEFECLLAQFDSHFMIPSKESN